jgi:hypothetical protein
VIVALVVVVALIVTYWYIAVPVLLFLGAAVALLAKAGAKANAEKAAQEAAARERAQQEWLAGPPPALLLPARFTDKWFAEHAPHLHPGQLPILFKELHERGWPDDRIARRVNPYLLRNPHLAPQILNSGG